MVTAITIPNQCALVGNTTNIPQTAGTMDNNFSIGGWIKVTSFTSQYYTLCSLLKSSNPGEGNSYLWWGWDSTAGGGANQRGWAFYLPAGGHMTTTIMYTDVWYHLCVTRNNNIWTHYTNGIAQYDDTSSGNPYVDFSTTVDEIDKITFGGEPDFGGDSTVNAACCLFVCRKTLSQSEVQTIMYQQEPGIGISGFNGVGVWKLSGPTDLSSTVGGDDLTLVGSGFGTTDGPAELSSNDYLNNPYFIRRRRNGFYFF